eukprot:8939074-Pyramimonas_sp.AAC.1
MDRSDLLETWPPRNYEDWHGHHLEASETCLRGRHWACQALAVLKICKMVHNSGMQKNRLQVKKHRCTGEARPTCGETCSRRLGFIMDPGPECGCVTPSGVAPNDGLHANDPWRNQAQQMHITAGQPAAFAPASRTTTPFGAPQ